MNCGLVLVLLLAICKASSLPERESSSSEEASPELFNDAGQGEMADRSTPQTASAPPSSEPFADYGERLCGAVGNFVIKNMSCITVATLVFLMFMKYSSAATMADGSWDMAVAPVDGETPEGLHINICGRVFLQSQIPGPEELMSICQEHSNFGAGMSSEEAYEKLQQEVLIQIWNAWLDALHHYLQLGGGH